MILVPVVQHVMPRALYWSCHNKMYEQNMNYIIYEICREYNTMTCIKVLDTTITNVMIFFLLKIKHISKYWYLHMGAILKITENNV